MRIFKLILYKIYCFIKKTKQIDYKLKTIALFVGYLDLLLGSLLMVLTHLCSIKIFENNHCDMVLLASIWLLDPILNHKNRFEKIIEEMEADYGMDDSATMKAIFMLILPFVIIFFVVIIK